MNGSLLCKLLETIRKLEEAGRQVELVMSFHCLAIDETICTAAALEYLFLFRFRIKIYRVVLQKTNSLERTQSRKIVENDSVAIELLVS